MKRQLHALSAAVLLSAASYASAATVNIGGLNVSVGPVFAVTSIYENFVGRVGNEVTGVGEITQLNGMNIRYLCAGCELTYHFGGYTMTSLTTTHVTFTGGWVNFYLSFGADNDFNPF